MLIALIYRKHAKVSEATNKDFDNGEIISFIQVDATRISWLCFILPGIVRAPLLIAVAFTTFYHFYQWTFLSGFAVVFVAILSQVFTGMQFGKAIKEMMQAKDDRLNITTEALNNPKMLKLYGWDTNFVRRIQRKRETEIVKVRKRSLLDATMIAQLYFWPGCLPIAVIATYIFLGGVLTLETTVSTLILFTLVRDAMNQFPQIVSAFM
jgi:ATP-binding cassette, subfamily C (CFTR/MRP), member 1